MSDITQDSYAESDTHTDIIFQKGRDVADYELNEAQNILRIGLFRSTNLSSGDGVESGIRVVSTGIANQVRVAIGNLVVAGYKYVLTAASTITGLTTPGGNRTDYVYARFVESVIDDPHPLTGIGVLSQRKKLLVTFHVVEGGAVPASTGMPWAGGTYYMTLAEIKRYSAQPIILNTDITQLYKLLPRATLDQTVQYLDGYADRLVAGRSAIVETPGVSLTLDVATGVDQGVYLDGDHLLRLRFNKGTADEISYTLDDTSLLTLNSRTTQYAFRIRDAITAGNEIPLSDLGISAEDASSGNQLRDPVGLVRGSIIRQLNGRAYLSVGDGVNSFGDYSGVDAITEAVAAATTATLSSIHIFLKPGTYEVDELNFGSMEVILEGESQSTAEIEGVGANPLLISTGKLTIKNLTIYTTGAATVAVNGKNLSMSKVKLVDLSVSMTAGSGINVIDNCYIDSVATTFNIGAFDTKGKLLIKDTYISKMANAPVLYVTTTGGPIGSVLFEDCHVVVGSGVDETSECGLADIETSYTPTSGSVYSLTKVKFSRCTVERSGAQSCFQVGVHAFPSLTFSKCVFEGDATNSAASQLPLFHPRAVDLVVEDCEFNITGGTCGLVDVTSGGAIDLYGTNSLTVRNMAVRKTVKEQFSGAPVSTQGMAVVHLMAGSSLLVDGISVRLTGGANGSGVIPRQVIHIESQGGTDTQNAVIRGIRHDRYSGEGSSACVTQAYLRIAGRFGRATLSESTFLFNSDAQIPAGVSAILLGGPAGDTLTTVGDITVENCTIGNLFGNGICDSGTSADVKIIRNCKVYNVGTWAAPYGFGIIATGDNSSVGTTQVVNCHVAVAANMGIRMDIPYATVRDCRTQDTSNGGGGLVGIGFTAGTPKAVHCFGNTVLDSTTGLGGIYVAFVTGPANRETTYGFDTRKDSLSAEIFTIGTCAANEPMQFNHANIVIV